MRRPVAPDGPATRPGATLAAAVGLGIIRSFSEKGNKDNMLAKVKDQTRGPLAILVAALLATLLGACADPDTLSEQQAGALEQRVRDRWQTIIARDFDRTWEFETPNYRSVFSKQLYAKKFSYGVEWELTEVEITHYDGRAAVASVAARVMTKSTKHTNTASQALGARPIIVREKWMLIDGEWWHSSKSIKG